MASIEKNLEKNLTKFAKDEGHLCLKLRPVMVRGFMDRTFFAKTGEIYFIELKDQGKYADPLQSAFRNNLVKVRQRPLLINSFEKLEKFKFHVRFGIPVPADSDLTHFEKP